ncbi:MAG: 50S ribosomal protein L23 [Proteobacteria bacterium]|nr:50S ribosomal protein L23 [Pseudomonadota bacterium]
MSIIRLMNIIQSPHVTEKTSQAMGDHRHYAFEVLPDANKFEIRQAIEQLLNVKVRSVQVCNVKGKVKRSARGAGRTKDWKKAYVVLAKDQEIDLNK